MKNTRVYSYIARGMLIVLLCSSTATLFGREKSDIPAFAGDWKGSFREEKNDPALVARVIGLGNDMFRIQILQEFDKRADLYLDIECVAQHDTLKFDQDGWKGTIYKNTFSGTLITEQGKPLAFELNKIQRQSPSLGLKPPPNSTILFDGTGLDKWTHPGRPDQVPVWEVMDGEMIIDPGLDRVNGKRQKNDLITKQSFTNIEIHLEFCVPYQADKRSQGRGNSGVFLQDFYELQILDSYGTQGLWNDCGALYKMSPPKVNASYPPGTWQTYDIVYYSPEYDNGGNIARNARITVRQNGVLIHNNTELIHPTAHSQSARSSGKAPLSPAPIKLQDHGNPVKFRNIWVLEL